jgi:hypothetical protein
MSAHSPLPRKTSFKNSSMPAEDRDDGSGPSTSSAISPDVEKQALLLERRTSKTIRTAVTHAPKEVRHALVVLLLYCHVSYKQLSLCNTGLWSMRSLPLHSHANLYNWPTWDTEGGVCGGPQCTMHFIHGHAVLRCPVGQPGVPWLVAALHCAVHSAMLPFLCYET